MTIIQQIGKHAFAFGGEWREVDDDLDLVLDEIRANPGYHTLLESRGSKQIGLFAISTEIKKSSVYSFAAQLAASGANGIYVLPMQDGRIWYAAIRDGKVTPGTDRIDRDDDALRSIETMVMVAARSGEERAVYSPLEIRQSGWKVFDPKEVSRKPHSKPLRKNIRKSKAPVAIAAIAIIALSGGLGWWQFVKIPADKRKAQEAEELNRQNYVALLTQQLQGIPRDHAWVNLAFDLVTQHAPYFFAGYTLKEVVCNPGSCQAKYESVGDTPRSPGIFVESLGQASVNPSGLEAIVTIQVNAETVEVDDALLRSWPSGKEQIADRIGMLPTYAPHLVMERDPVEEDLSAMAGATPVGYRPIKRVTLSLRTKEAMEMHPSDLAAIADYWANSSFVPVSVTWTTGLAGAQSGWSIELVRIAGE